MITLTVTADNAADLRTQLAAILGGSVSALPAAEAAPAAEAPKPTTRKAPAKAEEKPVEQVQETPAVEQAKGSPDKLDFNTDVAPLVVSTVETYGKPVVVEVLTQFGVAKASEVPEAQWGELIAALTDAAANATPLAA